MTKILIDRAVAEQALHVATGAGYPVALIAALKAALAEEALQRLTDVQQDIEAALAEPVPPIGKASTDVGVPVYVVKKAEPQNPCNPSCAPGYCYCDGIKEAT